MSDNPKHGGSYFQGTYNAQAVAVVTCSAISLYNSFELLVWIAVTFNKMHGLYFWSLLVATSALIPYTIGFILQYFSLTYQAVGMSLDGIGWIMMITGQSLVLYSRLGLLLQNSAVLRAVKWMIIIDACIWHPTTEAVNFCSTYGPSQHTCGIGYTYVEKIQMTVFCIQEFIISGLYLWQTAKLLKVVSKDGTRKVMWELFCINLLIICLDIGLLVVEYLDYHAMEQTVKGFVYSVKLKLEFVILGKLVDLVGSTNRNLSSAFAENVLKPTANQSEPDSEKTGFGRTMPEWVKDLEETSAEHIEHSADQIHTAPGQDKLANGSVAQTTSLDGMGSENSYTRAPVSDLQRRRTAESDYYAEALRSISSRGD